MIQQTHCMSQEISLSELTFAMEIYMTLKDLKIGESAVITNVGGEGELRQHFLDIRSDGRPYGASYPWI